MNPDNFLLHLPFFTKNECEEIVNYIERKEKFFKEDEQSQKLLEGAVTYGNTSNSTRLHSKYNFFLENKKYIPRLKKILEKNFPNLNYPLAVQSWCNLYAKGQGINWHTHRLFGNFDFPNSFTSNVFVGGREDIGITYALHHEGDIPRYKYVNVKNKLGHIQFVKSNIHHMVRSNPYDETRYTIGITVTEFHPVWARSILNMNDSFSIHGNNILIIPEKEGEDKTNLNYK